MNIIIVILSVVCVLLLVWLIRIRIAVRDLAGQNQEMSATDTNRLLRNSAGIKMFDPLINSFNENLKEQREKTLKAEKMNREIRESLTEISHDLRTPLTAASGYTGMLKNMKLTEEEKNRYIEVIEERFETSRNLVDQLFFYTRMESGAAELQSEDVDIRRILTDVLALYYPDFEKKKFDMDIDIDERPIIVKGDRDAFKRIFSNIVLNGLKHGEGDFKLSLKADDVHGVCRFTFSNLATNITQEDAEKLFDRYFTKDHVRSSSNTGLGLAIAKNLIEKMHGTCSAKLVGNVLSIGIEMTHYEEVLAVPPSLRDH
ncbi:MAG: HAMP domain-containing histidine kinase [Lachnospiraceae bacterium]|nr:HAMP domain-containing histidine kinase [Lachnospiraceae bacterium]